MNKENINIKNEMQPLVSILVPMYNAVGTLKETIDSVLNQTYENWEIILMDDCSTDNTFEYAKHICANDERIKVFKMLENGGPGAATKEAFKHASGDYIAFIDADDLWSSEKLEIQINFMRENGYNFTCTDYRWIDSNGEDLHKVIKCRKVADYKTILKCCPIGSSTVIVTKELLSSVDIPIIRKNNDYALWLKLLKNGNKVYGIDQILMEYRIIQTSNSFKKRKMIKYFWQVYREQEKFSLIKSTFLLTRYIFIKLVGIK